MRTYMLFILGILILSLFILAFISKGDNSHDDKTRIIKVRGCEYVLYSNAYEKDIEHAGDCSNPKHIRP